MEKNEKDQCEIACDSKIFNFITFKFFLTLVTLFV